MRKPWGGDGGAVAESVDEEDEDEDGSKEEDGDNLEVTNDEDDESLEAADDEEAEVTVIGSVEGTADDSCTVEGFGLPPASPRASVPHVFGSTLSSDVISKVGVFAQSSPEILSTCMWQMPF